MKKIFKTFVSCMVLTVLVTGCYDEMDDKQNVDSKYAYDNSITVSLGEVSAMNFSTLSVQGSVSDTKDVLETGFMISTTEDFTSYNTYKTDEKTASFSMEIGNLAELTTYYVRSYAYTLSDTKVSEVTSITTPVAPTFTLNGTYSAVEYYLEEDASETPGEPYEVKVEFVEGSTTDIRITNLWGGEKTVNAAFDPMTGKITIKTMQIIAVHDEYGDVWLEEPNGDGVVGATFVAKGGYLNINTFSAVCGAGWFGDQYIKMSHK